MDSTTFIANKCDWMAHDAWARCIADNKKPGSPLPPGLCSAEAEKVSRKCYADYSKLMELVKAEMKNKNGIMCNWIGNRV